MPKSVRAIEKNAFKKCERLLDVSFEEGSQPLVIDSGAFKQCGKLKEVVLPKNAQAADGAFPDHVKVAGAKKQEAAVNFSAQSIKRQSYSAASNDV